MDLTVGVTVNFFLVERKSIVGTHGENCAWQTQMRLGRISAQGVDGERRRDR